MTTICANRQLPPTLTIVDLVEKNKKSGGSNFKTVDDAVRYITRTTGLELWSGADINTLSHYIAREGAAWVLPLNFLSREFPAMLKELELAALPSPRSSKSPYGLLVLSTSKSELPMIEQKAKLAEAGMLGAHEADQCCLVRNPTPKAIYECFVIFAVVTFLVGIASPAFAQDQDGQLWVKLSAETPLTQAVSLNFEINQRLSNAEGGLYESQYLASVGVDIADGIKLAGGVNRVVDIEDGQVAAIEWRPRQQVNFPIATIGKGVLEGQFRLEQRFRSDGNDVGHRLRPKVVYKLPLGQSLKFEFGHESYFNLNTTDFGQQAGYERMRNFAELGFPVSGKVKASIGYLNQYRFNGSERDLMEHALTSGLSISFK